MGAESESISMQVISSISVLASFSIILLYHRFPNLKKKSSYTLQYYVALSSVLTSIGSAIGVVETGTIACWFQGLLTNIFTLSSIQWTTVMTFSLYSIVHYEKQLEVTPLIHLYCWLPPILVSVLPLVNSTYGNVGNWCWVIDTQNTPKWGAMFWFWVSFYGWVWFAMIIMIIILAEISYKSSHQHATTTVKSLRKVIYSLNLFPLVIFISWGPSCVFDTILQLFGKYYVTFGLISSQLACLQGLLTAILFWMRNKGARKLVPEFFQSDAKIHDNESKDPNHHHHHRGHHRQNSFDSHNSSNEMSSMNSSSQWSTFSEQVSNQLNTFQSRIKMEMSVSRRGSNEYQTTRQVNKSIAVSSENISSSPFPTTINGGSFHTSNLNSNSNSNSNNNNNNSIDNNNIVVNDIQPSLNNTEENPNSVRVFQDNKLKYELLHLFQESIEAV